MKVKIYFLIAIFAVVSCKSQPKPKIQINGLTIDFSLSEDELAAQMTANKLSFEYEDSHYNNEFERYNVLSATDSIIYKYTFWFNDENLEGVDVLLTSKTLDTTSFFSRIHHSILPEIKSSIIDPFHSFSFHSESFCASDTISFGVNLTFRSKKLNELLEVTE